MIHYLLCFFLICLCFGIFLSSQEVNKDIFNLIHRSEKWCLPEFRCRRDLLRNRRYSVSNPRQNENTVEREIKVLRTKLIKDTFIFSFKNMKIGFIMSKSMFQDLCFSKTYNIIVKTGILRYFREQTHQKYEIYFFCSKIIPYWSYVKYER